MQLKKFNVSSPHSSSNTKFNRHMTRGLPGKSMMIFTVCTVFFDPVHYKGNGPFEVINLEELEAVFQLVS